MNLLTSNLKCVECGCTDLIKDYTRCEIYCSECGLILADNTIPSLSDIETMANADVKPGRKNYHKFKRFYYGFNPMVNTPIWQMKR